MKSLTIVWTFVQGGFVLFAAAVASGQSLQYLQTITVPGWGPPGTAGTANVDVLSYNPVTRLMYLADRTNHGVDVIDTRANVVTAFLAMRPDSVPNVPLVAINLQKLAVTDGGPSGSVFVWDLRTGGAATMFTIDANPSACSATNVCLDGADYDPINQTFYVINDEAPYFLTGINLAYETVTTRTSLPWSADLIKFNPVDGKIYVSLEDADNSNAGAGLAVFDPANPNAPLGHIVLGPPCPSHGIDIDPITNVAVLGCAASAQAVANAAVNLSTSASKYIPDVGGTDAIVFNPNNRRFYMNATNYNSSAFGPPLNCPTSNSATNIMNKRPTVLGAIDTLAGAPAELAALACGGGGHIVGVDSITNYVYEPVPSTRWIPIRPRVA